MRIAIAAETDHGLDGPTSSHFGQAAHFVLIDCEGGQIMDSRSVPNPFAGAHKHGQIPRFLKQEGIDAVLSGGMGAGAITMFQRLGVTPVTGASGTVREAIERHLAGSLTGAAPCADSVSHHH